MKKNKKNPTKYILLVIPLIIVAVAVLELTNVTSFFGKSSRGNLETQAKTTSDAATAQEDFTDGDDRVPNAVSGSGEGTITDNEGNVGSIPDASQWSTSPDGTLAVYRPMANGVLKNGDSLNGKSSTNTISFRLIDNVTGVIARGELSVVDGKFSGKFNFATSATEGRLDVFNIGQDGTEYNNVEIPVKFR